MYYVKALVLTGRLKFNKINIMIIKFKSSSSSKSINNSVEVIKLRGL